MVVKMVLHNLLVLADLFLNLLQSHVNGRLEVLGLGFSKEIHAVAHKMAMSDSIELLRGEVPGYRNIPLKIFFENLGLLFNEDLKMVTWVHVLEANI